jgi:hypothetical protein
MLRFPQGVLEGMSMRQEITSAAQFRLLVGSFKFFFASAQFYAL